MTAISATFSSFDTDDLSIEELDRIIATLNRIRARKHQAQMLNEQMNELLAEARRLELEVYGLEDCVSGELDEIIVH